MKISISALSIAYGLTPEALRYYEEKGLLMPDRTPSSGFRRFSLEDVQLLGIIKSLQRQGFSLDEIRRIAKSGIALPELIAEGCGYVCEEINADSMYAAIQQVRQTGKTQYSHHCIEYATANFDKWGQYQKYCDYYRDILEKDK